MKKHISNIILEDLCSLKYENCKEQLSIDNYSKEFVQRHKELGLNIHNVKEIMEEKLSNYISINEDKLDLNTYFNSDIADNIKNKKYNNNYIKNLYKEKFNNTIRNVYIAINEIGNETNYNEINRYLLDCNIDLKNIKNTSHYCKYLMKTNRLISNISIQNSNEKLISINNTKFHQLDNIDFDERDNEDENENNNNENEENMTTVNMNLNLSMNEKLGILPFLIDKNNIENNILFFLCVFKEGLNNKEISYLIDMNGKEKSVVRIINELCSQNIIKKNSIRNGKIFEYSYTIEPNNFSKIPEYIKDLAKNFNEYQNSNNLNKSENINVENKKNIQNSLFENIKSDIRLRNDDDQATNKINEKLETKLILKNTDSTLESQSITQNLGISKNITIQHSSLISNNPYITNLVSITSNDIQSKGIDYIYDEYFDMILSDIKCNSLNININLSNIHLNEVKKKIILDYVYSKLSDKQGLKSFSNISFNRLIFILNQIYLHKVLSVNDIKHLIYNCLEKNMKIKIDRKTICNMLEKLEKLNLIKLNKYEISMSNPNVKYTKKDEIIHNKILAFKKDIQESDDIYQQSLNSITTNCNQKSNYHFSDNKNGNYLNNSQISDNIFDNIKLEESKNSKTLDFNDNNPNLFESNISYSVNANSNLSKLKKNIEILNKNIKIESSIITYFDHTLTNFFNLLVNKNNANKEFYIENKNILIKNTFNHLKNHYIKKKKIYEFYEYESSNNKNNRNDRNDSNDSNLFSMLHCINGMKNLSCYFNKSKFDNINLFNLIDSLDINTVEIPYQLRKIITSNSSFIKKSKINFVSYGKLEDKIINEYVNENKINDEIKNCFNLSLEDLIDEEKLNALDIDFTNDEYFSECKNITDFNLRNNVDIKNERKIVNEGLSLVETSITQLPGISNFLNKPKNYVMKLKETNMDILFSNKISLNPIEYLNKKRNRGNNLNKNQIKIKHTSLLDYDQNTSNSSIENLFKNLFTSGGFCLSESLKLFSKVLNESNKNLVRSLILLGYLKIVKYKNEISINLP